MNNDITFRSGGSHPLKVKTSFSKSKVCFVNIYKSLTETSHENNHLFKYFFYFWSDCIPLKTKTSAVHTMKLERICLTQNVGSYTIVKSNLV